MFIELTIGDATGISVSNVCTVTNESFAFIPNSEGLINSRKTKYNDILLWNKELDHGNYAVKHSQNANHRIRMLGELNSLSIVEFELDMKLNKSREIAKFLTDDFILDKQNKYTNLANIREEYNQYVKFLDVKGRRLYFNVIQETYWKKLQLICFNSHKIFNNTSEKWKIAWNTPDTSVQVGGGFVHPEGDTSRETLKALADMAGYKLSVLF